jgi:hypothetical protein
MASLEDTSCTKALFRAYRPAVGEPAFKVLVSLVEFGSAQTRSTLGSRGQRSTVCARSFHVEIWPRLPCTRGTKSTAATLTAKFYRRSLFVEPLAAPGGAEFGAVPSAKTVSWPPSDV